MANLNTDILSGVPFLVPPDRVLRVFNDTVQPLMNRIVLSDTEAETLAALRDTLLPKLISGELRVQDAQRFVDGVDSMDEVDGGGT